MDHTICPICGNPLKLKYRLKFNVYKCASCGLLNSDAHFEHSFQSDLESESRDIGLKQLRLKNFVTIIKELLKYQGDKGKKISGMEIGCGNGWGGGDCTSTRYRIFWLRPQ